MIEDDDNFRQNESLMPSEEQMQQEEGHRHSIMVWLIVLALWIVWTAGCILLFRTRVVSAIEESGVIPLIENMKTSDQILSERTVVLSYPRPDGTSQTVEAQVPRLGGDIYHDTVEALFTYYPYEAFSEGAVNLVQEGRLIGLTCEKGICYVDFTQDILGNPCLGEYTALNQVEDTLLGYDEIEKVVFLIEGESLDSGY